MTFPITEQHAIGSALSRYTRIPPAFPDPGDGSGGGIGHVELGGSATVSGTVRTIFGYNYNSNTSFQTIDGRKAKFNNRVPCVRNYGSVLDGTFSVSSTTAQEKRVADSFKAGGSYTSAELASSSAALTAMKNYLRSIPSNWTVYWCYHHEPNSANTTTGMEVPVSEFKGTYDQMLAAKAAVIADGTLNPGVKVYITANFMAYQVRVGKWDDNWIPNCDILTWDIYGNPGQFTSATGTNKYGTATGSAYGTTYPIPLTRTQPVWDVTEATGYAASWGVLEVNAPMRNWDINEAGRKAWHQDMLALFNAPPMTGKVPPKICLLWEAPSGINWVQGYGYNDSASLDSRWAGGTIPYSSTKAENSLLWDVWKPYMTGTPVGG